ncbi:hypothetical protein V6N11_058566 [Hibiscus sabdariffa]|uniref:Uncharacterized protein n=1 Tax=Hibiscus sabdariffa TaxID=183260 RepID=A0ABR2U4X5_9ROSI
MDGVFDREAGRQPEQKDVMCCVQPVLLQEAPVVWETDGESPGIVLELEWNSHQDKPLGIPISKSNDCLDNSVNFSTALTYTETDLVHVPITGIPDLAESSMELEISPRVLGDFGALRGD